MIAAAVALAAALAAAVPTEALPLAAGAYRDGTRVAGADAGLWTGIFLENRGPILDALGVFRGRLEAFRQALEDGDADRLHAWWSAARASRALFDSDPSSRMPDSR